MRSCGVRYVISVFLPAAILLFMQGCAHVPPPVSEEIRSSFGNVAVVSCGEIPEGEFFSPTSGKWAGAAKGTLAWMDECVKEGELGFLLLVPVGVIGGAVYGAVEAPPGSEVDASSAAIEQSLANTYLGNQIQNSVIEQAVENTRYDVALVDFDCPADPAVEPDYRQLCGLGVGTVIEIEVIDFSFDGRWADIDPEINLALAAHVRLINTKDRAILYERTFRYAGEKMTYGTWAQNNAYKLRKEIGRACNTLARNIVREVFIAGPDDESGKVIEKPSILKPAH